MSVQEKTIQDTFLTLSISLQEGFNVLFFTVVFLFPNLVLSGTRQHLTYLKLKINHVSNINCLILYCTVMIYLYIITVPSQSLLFPTLRTYGSERLFLGSASARSLHWTTKICNSPSFWTQFNANCIVPCTSMSPKSPLLILVILPLTCRWRAKQIRKYIYVITVRTLMVRFVVGFYCVHMCVRKMILILCQVLPFHWLKSQCGKFQLVYCLHLHICSQCCSILISLVLDIKYHPISDTNYK